jgi:hypothetical protein
MKNKRDSEILWTSYLYDETVCRPSQSHEAIPLKRLSVERKVETGTSTHLSNITQT